MSEKIGWADFCNALKWADAPSELKKILPKATACFKRPVVPFELLYFMFNLENLVAQPKDKAAKKEYGLIVKALKNKKPAEDLWGNLLLTLLGQELSAF